MGTLATRPHRGVKVDSIDDFSGGLNTRFAANKLKDNESPTCTNVYSFTNALKKRQGFKVTVTGSQALSLGIGFGGSTKTIGGSSRIWFMNGTVFYTGQIVPVSGASQITPCIDSNQYGGTQGTAYTTGTITVTNGSNAITGVGTSWLSNGVKANDLLIVDSNTNVSLISAVTSNTALTTVDNQTVASGSYTYGIFPYVSSSTSLGLDAMNSNVYCPDGTGGVIEFANANGATWKRFTLGQNVALALAHQNYMFYTVDSGNPSRLWWSGLKAPTSIPAANFIDFNPNDGTNIVGAFLDGQSLVIIKNRSLWKLNGMTFDPTNPTYSVTRIYTPPECIFAYANTVQANNGVWLMFAQNGIYAYYGGNFIQRLTVSDKIQGEWDGFLGLSNLNNTKSAAIFYKGYYYLSLSSGSGNPTTMYVLDPQGAFWKWSTAFNGGNMPSTFFYCPITSKTGLIAGVDNYGWYMDTGSTDGADAGSTAAINGTWTSKVFDYNSQQSFGRLWVDFKKQTAGNLTVEYSIDEGAFTSSTVDMTVGTGTRVKSQEIVIGQVGQSIQFRVSNNVAAQDFEVYSISWERKGLRN